MAYLLDQSGNYLVDSAAGDNRLTDVVTGAPTATIALTSSANPSMAGNAVVLTATVSGSTTMPTGSVTFMDGATTLGSAVPLSGGVATLSTIFSVLGAHPLTAIYGGNSTYAGVTSSVLTQTVNAPSGSLPGFFSMNFHG